MRDWHLSVFGYDMAMAMDDGLQITLVDRQMMGLALDLAERAGKCQEVPVGAVIYKGEQVIATGSNLREHEQDPTAHAEIVAIRHAAKELKQWRLLDCTLLVTLEPCPMCAGALVNARVARLIYGASDPKMGSVASLHRLCDDERFNHQLQIIGGLEAQRCGELLSDFFRGKRLEAKRRKSGG